MKEYVQSFQNMYGKGGYRESLRPAELRPAEVDPCLKKKKKTVVRCTEKLHGFQKKFMPNPPERRFIMLFKNFSQLDWQNAP